MREADSWVTQALVAVFDNHDGARHALRAIQRFGITAEALSVLGKGITDFEQAAGIFILNGTPKMFGGISSILDDMWEPLPSHALVWIKSVGLVAGVGPIVRSLANAIEAARREDPHTISTFGDALAAIGAPASSIVRHETELADGKILVIVHGRLEELLQVQSLLLEIHVFDTELLAA
jgi:hypothetical protein